MSDKLREELGLTIRKTFSGTYNKYYVGGEIRTATEAEIRLWEKLTQSEAERERLREAVITIGMNVDHYYANLDEVRPEKIIAIARHEIMKAIGGKAEGVIVPLTDQPKEEPKCANLRARLSALEELANSVRDWLIKYGGTGEKD